MFSASPGELGVRDAAMRLKAGVQALQTLRPPGSFAGTVSMQEKSRSGSFALSLRGVDWSVRGV